MHITIWNVFFFQNENTFFQSILCKSVQNSLELSGQCNKEQFCAEWLELCVCHDGVNNNNDIYILKILGQNTLQNKWYRYKCLQIYFMTILGTYILLTVK